MPGPAHTASGLPSPGSHTERSGVAVTVTVIPASEADPVSGCQSASGSHHQTGTCTKPNVSTEPSGIDTGTGSGTTIWTGERLIHQLLVSFVQVTDRIDLRPVTYSELIGLKAIGNIKKLGYLNHYSNPLHS